LVTDQVNVLKTTQVAALNSYGIQAMNSYQVAALTTYQIAAIESYAVPSLNSYSLAALTTTQTMAFTVAQISQLNTGLETTLDNIGTDNDDSYTPIVLDLNDNGVHTLSITDGVQFDLYASGQKVHTGWVSSEDGLLVLDRNNDRMVNDGSELFGSATTLANGDKAKDGYAALRELDSNDDNALTDADAQWANLKLWVDKNSDGISQKAEMLTLDSLGITKLNLGTETTSINDNGNVIGLTSSYETRDGETHEMADVWFATETDQAANAVGGSEQAAVEEGQDLRTRVSGLAQAISAFDDSQFGAGNTAASSTAALLPSSSQLLIESQAVAISVGGIVDTLKRFDINGNLIANSAQTSSPLQTGADGQSLANNIQDPTKTGFLAS
jgi:hypothetical protein